jgi:hypothetical protein
MLCGHGGGGRKQEAVRKIDMEREEAGGSKRSGKDRRGR